MLTKLATLLRLLTKLTTLLLLTKLATWLLLQMRTRSQLTNRRAR